MSDEVMIRIEGLWKRYGLPLPEFMRKGWNLLTNKNESPAITGRMVPGR